MSLETFSKSDPLTLGVELELQIVGTHDYDLSPAAGDLKTLMLAGPRLSLAVAESLTCGLLEARVGSISGASEFFRGGITAYTLDEKARHLGVDRSAAAPVNCVSSRVAEQMARGACELFGSDVGVATTGYAEPSPAWGVATPHAWWAVAFRSGGGTYAVKSGRLECPGLTRTQVQNQVCAVAFEALLRALAERRAAA